MPKSLLEQLEEAENLKKAMGYFAELEPFLLKRLEEKGISEVEEITADIMLESCVDTIRPKLYAEFPLANPIVVEGLLLTYKNFTKALIEEIEAVEGREVQLHSELSRLVKAIKATLQTMS